MAVYKIKFINQNTNPSARDYTLYGAPPTVKGLADSTQFWSNSFLTRTVNPNGEWNMAVNSSPLAYCGTSSARPLAGGVNINVTETKAVTLGGQSAGSTLHMYSQDGYPSFRDEDFTAPPGTYQITAGMDFGNNLNWVAGYALSDGSGQSRPVATFGVSNNNRYTILPPQAPKFFLVNYKTSPVAIVDHEQMQSYAEIDFAQHPGQNNAVVTRNAYGGYKVEFLTEPMFAMRTTTSASSSGRTSSVQLTQLRHQINIMSDLIKTALGESESPTIGNNRWACTLQWTNNPSNDNMNAICSILRQSMGRLGYIFRSQQLQPELTMIFVDPARRSGQVVLYDWVNSALSLPAPLKRFVLKPRVQPIYFATGSGNDSSIGTLQVPEVELPVLRPDYVCSVEWLEGPSDDNKRYIAAILKRGMEDQQCYTFEPKISDASLIMPVWHVQTLSTDTVLAYWKRAIRLLLEEHLGNYVTDPKVEPIIRTMNEDSQVNGQKVNDAVGATIFPPPTKATHVGYLTWLEGPSQPVKDGIMGKMHEAMVKQGFEIFEKTAGEEKLEMFFRRDPEQVTTMPLPDFAWRTAYDSLGFERMFVGEPVCEDVASIAANSAAVPTVFPPPTRATHVGYLTWLEGPPEAVKKAIAERMSTAMSEKGFDIEGQKIDDERLAIYFFLDMSKPSTMPIPADSWREAYEALGFERMFVSNPVCEPVATIATDKQTTDATTSSLGSTYNFKLTWLEGPPQQFKDIIAQQLRSTMEQTGWRFLSQNLDDPTLQMILSGAEVIIPEKPMQDWTSAYNSLGLLQNYVTDPQYSPVDDKTTTSSLILPVGYICSLDWLEGPNQKAQQSIVDQLSSFMKTRDYFNLSSRNSENSLELFCSHLTPSDVESATRDWLAARDSLSFQAMYTGNLKVEYEITTNKNGTTNTAPAAGNGVSGENGVSTQKADEELPPVSHQRLGDGDQLVSHQQAPDPLFSTQQATASYRGRDETLEEKKRRALELLQREGLVGIAA